MNRDHRRLGRSHPPPSQELDVRKAKVPKPLHPVAMRAMTHRQLFTFLQYRIKSLISVFSAHRRLAPVDPCLCAEGWKMVVSLMVNPSSFSNICTFHLLAPLIPGSM